MKETRALVADVMREAMVQAGGGRQLAEMINRHLGTRFKKGTVQSWARRKEPARPLAVVLFAACLLTGIRVDEALWGPEADRKELAELKRTIESGFAELQEHQAAIERRLGVLEAQRPG
jgi:hypothetical protein